MDKLGVAGKNLLKKWAGQILAGDCQRLAGGCQRLAALKTWPCTKIVRDFSKISRKIEIFETFDSL